MMATVSATLLMAGSAPAWSQTAPKEGVGDVVCQLLDNCSDDAPAAATPAPSPRGTPRTTATRGFSLARPKAAEAAPAAAPAPAAKGVKQAYAPSKPAKPKAAATAATKGSYDLRVTFRSGSADLAPSAKSRATMFATALQDPRLAGRRVRIEGHTDSVGNPESNRELSERRARAVADALVAQGVDTSRLDVAGYGSSQPLPGLAPSNGEQRRVVAVLVK